jgi:type VI protein secretion system component Hcp
VAFDIFLKLTGDNGVLIKGESVVKGHENEIEVHSFSWGESRDAGVTDPQEMALVTPMSVASPTIAKLCADGTPVSLAQISVVRTGGAAGTPVVIKLAGGSIGSYQLGVAETDPGLSDRFTLSFTTMELTKRQQNPITGATAGEVTTALQFPPPAP